MKQITLEWVSKAEADYGTARREFDVKGDRNYDAVCFHGQQCVEKYLKARLQEADIAFMRTHDLTILLDLVLALEPTWESFRAELHQLTAFAVESRSQAKHPTNQKLNSPWRLLQKCDNLRGKHLACK